TIPHPFSCTACKCAVLRKGMHRFPPRNSCGAARKSYQESFRGCDLKSFRFRKNPRCSVIPCLKRFHNSEQPICASVALINKSCFSSASAKEQLGVSSNTSDCFNSSPYSSVIKGSFP